MDDVFGEVVFVGRDENFCFVDGVVIVGVGFGVGFYLVEIGVVLWFGEVYGVVLVVFGEWN